MPTITTVTTNLHVQIVRLRASHPYHPPSCTQIRTNINVSSPLARRGSLFGLKKPSTETVAFNPCNSCNLQFIVDFLLPVIFFRFEFSRKKILSLLCCGLFSLTLLIPTQLFPRLWWGSTIRSFVAKNLHHKLMLSLQSEVPTLRSLSYQNTSSKSLSNESWLRKSSQPPTKGSSPKANQSPSLGTSST